MSQIGVHPRISERHPEVSEADVMAAMRSMIRYKQRDTGEWLGGHPPRDGGLRRKGHPEGRVDSPQQGREAI